VFFKILGGGGARAQLFMKLGFIGEAASFVIMGCLELGQAFMVDSPDEEAEGATNKEGQQVAEAGKPARASARKMMEEKVSDDLNVMMGALGKEVKQFGGEIHEMVGEMKQARMAVQDMRSKLNEVATGELAKDAERLGDGMNSLGTEMESAGSAVEEMRDDLDEMLRRFRQFNQPQNGTSDVN